MKHIIERKEISDKDAAEYTQYMIDVLKAYMKLQKEGTLAPAGLRFFPFDANNHDHQLLLAYSLGVQHTMNEVLGNPPDEFDIALKEKWDSYEATGYIVKEP